MHKRQRQAVTGLLVFGTMVFSCPALYASDGTIKIGISTSISGGFANVGQSTKQAAELAKKEVDQKGGIQIGSKKYTLAYEYVDNTSSRAIATSKIFDLIGQKHVLAIVGPQSSDRAIAVGQIANSFKTPMISPWSTSPLTTKGRPYVFRMAAMIDMQSAALTKFVAKEWTAKTAAILYDEISPYPSGFAKQFKKDFEQANGSGSIVEFKTFRTGESDFSKQLGAIVNSKADFLFVPQHDTEVPLIVRQAYKMGWKKPIIGGNAWAGGDLMGQCGDDCKGLYFSGNFAAGGTSGIAKNFVDQYQALYKTLPDEPAALTYDSIKLIVFALEQEQNLSGNIIIDRENLQKKLSTIKGFKGVTGAVNFDSEGNPAKCVVVVNIDDKGEFITYDTLCP